MTYDIQPKCDKCGRFISLNRFHAWKMLYSGAILEPDHIIYRCDNCIKEHGIFRAQMGIEPEYSCGLVEVSNDKT